MVGFFIAFITASIYYSKLSTKLIMWVPFPSGGSSTGLKLLFDEKGLESAYYNAISFFLIFILVKIALQIVASLFDFLASFPLLKQFNHLLGGLLGFIEFYVMAIVVITILAMVPVATIQHIVQGSFVAKLMILHTPLLSSIIESMWF
jgi:uncharacterized membrane protein required for colicin V production